MVLAAFGAAEGLVFPPVDPPSRASAHAVLNGGCAGGLPLAEALA